MRLAGGYVVGSLRLVPGASEGSVFGSVVMALGAGFYEEVAFRVTSSAPERRSSGGSSG